MRPDWRLLLAVLVVGLFALAGCSGESKEVCGDGVVEGLEQCDDSNARDGDGCSSRCESEQVATGPECGNGVREVGEACDDGNTRDGDGCQSTCVRTPTPVTQCAALPAVSSGATCEVTRAGNGARLFQGVVLKDTGVLHGGQVLVDAQGLIQCAECDCSGAPGAAEATVISCPQGVISPGLINAHDHITYQGAPKPLSEERYEHRHDWNRGTDGHTRLFNDSSVNDAIRWGELRQVLAGTTSVAGSGGQPGLLRNLDKENVTTTGGNQQGLDEPPLNYETFPLGDSSNGLQLTSGCAYPGIDTPAAIPPLSAYLPHVSEGIEEAARNEFRCLSGASGGQNLLTRQTAIIHGIGLTAAEIGDMASRGTDLIWSPRSNVALYGDTAMVTAYRQLGVTLALGTDWLPTGSMNLLRELQCADYLNTSYYARAFSDEELWRMVTANAADLTDVQEKLGRIEQGKVADLAIFRLRTFADSPHRAVITANAQDVVLTLRGGKPLYGEQALVSALGVSGCEGLEVCGAQRVVCVSTEVGKAFSVLAQANANSYPLFFCDGGPKDEPVCSPQRLSTNALYPASVNNSRPYSGAREPGDVDGDGLANGQDNCPIIFNPIRPMDNGTQADTDGDGVGDACDECPLMANAAGCAVPVRDDEDGDSNRDWLDNCPYVANADQADGDGDGHGDACDGCARPNPGGMACEATIYDVKRPVAGVNRLLNHHVTLRGVLVTALASDGFFVQVHPDEVGRYQGPDYSGLFVFTSTAPRVTAGDRVNITEAKVVDFYGQIELTDLGSSQITRTSSGQPLPLPVQVNPADVRTGGRSAAALEGVLVELSNVYVTKQDTFNEFIVDTTTGTDGDTAGVRVDDYLYLRTPMPAVGTKFRFLRGVLTFRNGNSKVVPRSAQDFVLPPPSLTAFGPPGQYVRLGTAGEAFPRALTVTMGGTYFEEVAVLVESDSPALHVAHGGIVRIPAGQTTGRVELEPVEQAGSVTLTARLDDSMRTTTVRVLGESEQPEVVSVSPARAVAAPGRAVRLTVRLDRPAPAGTVLSVSAGPEGFGTVTPASLSVPLNAMEARFTFTADAAPSATEGTVTVSLGTSSASSSVVLGDSVPSLVSMTPGAPLLVAPGGTRQFTLTLDSVALYDTLVEVVAVPDVPEEPYGSVPMEVVVPMGQSSATFTFTGGSRDGANGWVRASLDTVSLATQVQVGTRMPRLSSLTPPTATVFAGTTQAFTVTLDRPALGDTSVALALEPAGGAGAVPGSVAVPAGMTSATFLFTAEAAPTAKSATLTASLDGLAVSSKITVSKRGLVINEVDYDNPGTDTREFVEIYNSSSAPIPLAGMVLVFVNGGSTPPSEYVTPRVDLAPLGELGPGQYILVGPASVLDLVSSSDVKEIPFTRSIQNDTEAVGILDTARGVLVDSLSYEGQVMGATLTGVPGTFNLQEGTESTTLLKDPNPAGDDGSLSRIVNGLDTNTNATDFRFTKKLTPGAPNEP
jgi:cysteine-rich repeat protein